MSDLGRFGAGVERLVAPGLGLTLLLGAWAAASLVWADPLIFPGPIRVFQAFWQLFEGDHQTGSALAWTVFRTCLAFFVSVALGVPIGLKLGSSNSLRATWGAPVDFFRSIPPIALLPVFILLLGIGNTTLLAIPTYGATLIIVVNTAHGVLSAEPLRGQVGKAFGLSERERLWRITFWDALPQVSAGMRIALSIVVVLTVVAEMLLTTKPGIGRAIIDAFDNPLRISEGYAIILLAGFLGYGLNRLYLAGERRWVHWGADSWVA